MKRTTCFLSYSREEENQKIHESVTTKINQKKKLVNYSERHDKRAFNSNIIWNYIHNRISGSSCTILLLTKDLLERNKKKIDYIKGNFLDSGWVYNEICASLQDRKNNKLNALVCVICNDMKLENIRNKLPKILTKGDNSEYIVWAYYNDFINEPYWYISEAMKNRRIQLRTNKYKIECNLHNK